jgi:hypothetical protein
MFVIAKSVALHHSRSTWRILPGNLRVTQSACYALARSLLLLEFNKLRCIQHGHRLFTAFVANANELHTPNKKRKSSNPSPLHTEACSGAHAGEPLRSLCLLMMMV